MEIMCKMKAVFFCKEARLQSVDLNFETPINRPVILLKMKIPNYLDFQAVPPGCGATVLQEGK